MSSSATSAGDTPPEEKVCFEASVRQLFSINKHPPNRTDVILPNGDEAANTFINFVNDIEAQVRSRSTVATLIATCHLTRNEVRMLIAYKAERPYPLYRLLNAWLMSNPDAEEFDFALKRKVAPCYMLLCSALEKLPLVTKNAARAARVKPSEPLQETFERYNEHFAPQSPIHFWGFASFSTNHTVIRSAAFCGADHEEAIIYSCNPLCGVEIDMFRPPSMPPEHELLVAAPSTFKVKGVIKVLNKVHVEMEQQQDEQAGSTPPLPLAAKSILHALLLLSNTSSLGAAEWCAHGVELEKDTTAAGGSNVGIGISDAAYHCFINAIKCDPAYSAAWVHLGSWLERPPHPSHATINGTKFTACECFVKAVECDAENSQAWHALVKSMRKDSEIDVHSVKYTKQDCCVKALERDPSTSFSWNKLGIASGRNTTVVVNGTPHTDRECYVQALTLDPQNGDAWNSLGTTVVRTLGGDKEEPQVSIGGATFSRRACYVKAVELDPTHHRAWANLGMHNQRLHHETVVVNGVEYTNRDCCVKAVEIAPSETDVWAALAVVLGVDEAAVVNKVAYTKKSSFVKALECDLENDYAWERLVDVCGDTNMAVNGTVFTARDCYIRALRSNPRHSTAWCNLGVEMRRKESLTVNGVVYTQQACFVEALACDAENSEAWNNLGCITTSPANEEKRVVVNGREYSNRECILKALECGPEHSIDWTNLGLTMSHGEEVTVKGRGSPYTQRGCYLQALALDEHDGRAWANLGTTIPALGGRVIVNGVEYTHQDCFLRALEHCSRCSLAWKCLGDTLIVGKHTTKARKETPPLEGLGTFTRRECYIKAVECDMHNANAWKNLADTMGGDGGEKRVRINGVSHSQRQCYNQSEEKADTTLIEEGGAATSSPTKNTTATNCNPLFVDASFKSLKDFINKWW